MTERTLAQDYDFFFISQSFLNSFCFNEFEVMIITKNDFFRNPQYSSVHTVSCFALWRVDFDFVIVANIGWYERQSFEIQQKIKDEQVRLDSKMVWNDSLITQKAWQLMTSEQREIVLSSMDEEAIELQQSTAFPKKFLNLHNLLPVKHGPNCFGAVSFALTNNQMYLEEWVFEDTFELLLSELSYRAVNDTNYNTGDVILFENEEGKKVHAAYVIDNAFCFNKNGQTFHERWQIISIDHLKYEWETFKNVTYRKH